MLPTYGQGAPAQVAAKETAARTLVPGEFPVSLPLSMPTMQAIRLTSTAPFEQQCCLFFVPFKLTNKEMKCLLKDKQ